MKKLSIALIAGLATANAFACVERGYVFQSVTLTSDGEVGRVRPGPESEVKPEHAMGLILPEQIDRVKLERGEAVLLNAQPGSQDVLYKIKVRILGSVDRGTIYEVTEKEYGSAGDSTGNASDLLRMTKKKVIVIGPPKGAKSTCSEVREELIESAIR